MHLTEELENCKVRGLVSLKLTIRVNNVKISVDSTLILTKMKMKLDLLIENRDKIGYGNNPYVFGLPGKQGHLRSWDILRKYCKKINIRGVTSTALRRYLATSAQEYIK